MKAFNGFEAKKSASREVVPAGGYVGKILNAEEITYSWGSVLLISFDITEGKYKDFFARDYKAQDREDKKWRGTLRLNVPKDDNTEQDGWTKRTFGNAMWAINESNPGYSWDWNETGLKGKSVGFLFRNREWEMNGNTGWTTECCALASVEDVRNGAFKMPKDKPLKAAANTAFAPIETSDNELPF